MRKQEDEEDRRADTSKLVEEILVFGHMLVLSNFTCDRVCVCAVCVEGNVCVDQTRSPLFARRLQLMSLKGQTPLREINGVS